MVRYTGYITANNNNKKGNDMNTFQQYETRIGKGESEALAAWWDAGADMVAAIAKGTYKDVAAFATAWAKVSKSWKYNTINVNMGVIKWAIEMGYKCDEFKSLQHVKRTRSESAVKRQPKKVSEVDKWFAAYEKMSKREQAEIKALILKK